MKMPINNRILPFLFIFAFILSACDTSLVFPIEPKVDFLDIQPRIVQHLQDSIVVTIKFQDGDGNLGAIEEGDINLKLIDDRALQSPALLTLQQATNGYSIPNLTPDARNPAIQGEISVTIPLTINQLGPGTEQEVRYQIQLFDRDGNLASPIDGEPGNAVFTDYITVVR